MTEREAKERNLKMIDEWCKNLMKDTDNVLDCGTISNHNGEFRIMISRNGIELIRGWGEGVVLRVNPRVGDGSLVAHSIGTELIYQWKCYGDIKDNIKYRYNEMMRKEKLMFEFEV